MPDWTAELLAGLDGPRPLPDRVQDRMQAALEARELAAIDAPRPLPPPLQLRLEDAMRIGRRRRPTALVPLGLAAALLLVLGLAAVAFHGAGRSSHRLSTAAGSGTTSTADGGQLSAGAAGDVGSAASAAAGAAQAGSSVTTATTASPVGGAAGEAATATGAAAGASGTSSGAASGKAGGVSSVRPGAGPLAGGTAVVISGHDLSRVVAVQFGPAAARSFTVRSDAEVDAVTPPGSARGPVPVTVVLASGTRYTLSPGFDYVPQPVVSSISPTSGPSAGGTWVTVTGQALTGTSEVDFGDAKATQFKVDSDGKLEALSPNHIPGVVDVTVRTPGGTSAVTSGDRYLFLF